MRIRTSVAEHARASDAGWTSRFNYRNARTLCVQPGCLESRLPLLGQGFLRHSFLDVRARGRRNLEKALDRLQHLATYLAESWHFGRSQDAMPAVSA